MNNDIVPGFDQEQNDSVGLKLQKIGEIRSGLIVYVSGYIDVYNSVYFRKSVEKLIEAGFVRIIFEMSRVTYISSTGWGAFSYFLQALQPLGGDIVLAQVHPKVFEAAELLGLAQYFNPRENIEESIGYFAPAPAPTFPTVFACPACSKRLRASRAGRFRCSECKTIIMVDGTASVTLVGAQPDACIP